MEGGDGISTSPIILSCWKKPRTIINSWKIIFYEEVLFHERYVWHQLDPQKH